MGRARTPASRVCFTILTYTRLLREWSSECGTETFIKSNTRGHKHAASSSESTAEAPPLARIYEHAYAVMIASRYLSSSMYVF
jgi:hypothetical protein